MAVIGVGRLVKPLKIGDFQGPTVNLQMDTMVKMDTMDTWISSSKN